MVGNLIMQEVALAKKENTLMKWLLLDFSKSNKNLRIKDKFVVQVVIESFADLAILRSHLVLGKRANRTKTLQWTSRQIVSEVPFSPSGNSRTKQE